MKIPFKRRIEIFISAGTELDKVLGEEDSSDLSPAARKLKTLIAESIYKNPWYTAENVSNSLAGIREMLKPEALNKWLSKYQFDHQLSKTQRNVLVIMAGNIPAVGFHDMMCVLLSGHKVLVKLSSQDTGLTEALAELLTEQDGALSGCITFTDGPAKGFDAVIATGSNNSARYFEYYFGKYPHIIRKNRSSMAVLSGSETDDQLVGLSRDIFTYFGMGCRNVSLIFVPRGYQISKLIDSFRPWEYLKDHSKYFNNYEYQRAILLVNRKSHLDSGFVLLLNQQQLLSPIAVINYCEYEKESDVSEFTNLHYDQIQCVVSDHLLQDEMLRYVPFGRAQFPAPSDYADGVDTLQFLSEL